MRSVRISTVVGGVALAAAAAIGFAVPAQADPGVADLDVDITCGGALPGLPPPLHVVVRNRGNATAENLAVSYWVPFGPSDTIFKADLEPGGIANFTVGAARILELAAARVTSSTPDASFGNDVAIEPMVCFSSF